MKIRNFAVAIGITLGTSQASLLRTNDQGYSETHTYTQVGDGENVSNLNANAVITEPLADVPATPLGIHLDMTYNSHWRDPLWYDIIDYEIGSDGSVSYKNWDASSGFNNTRSFGGGAPLYEKKLDVNLPGHCYLLANNKTQVSKSSACNADSIARRDSINGSAYMGGIFSQQHYSIPGMVPTKSDFYVEAVQASMASQAGWVVTQAVYDKVANSAPPGWMNWGMSAFSVAFLAVNIDQVYSNWDNLNGVEQAKAIVSLGASGTITGLEVAAMAEKSLGKSVASQSLSKAASVVAFAYELYNIGMNLGDGGYEASSAVPGSQIAVCARER